MRTRSFITISLTLVVNAVVFGTGAIIVLSVPALREHMVYLLPAVIIASLIMSPFIAWFLAPRMRARFWHSRRHRLMRHIKTPDNTVN